MLCPNCQTYADQDAVVCPTCGRVLPRGTHVEVGVQAIRQGRKAREAAAAARQEAKESAEKPPMYMTRQGQGRTYEDPVAKARDKSGQIPVYAGSEVFGEEGLPLSAVSREASTRTFYGDTTIHGERYAPQRPIRRKDQHPVTRHMINWTHVGVVVAILMVFVAISFLVFLSNTPAGQRILARMGREATSAALWEVGEEKLDIGDIDGAIRMFLEAKEKDGEENVNVSGLLMLGSAYEAAGLLDEAERLYTEIYTDIVPSAPDAYTNTIRIMLQAGRGAEAAALMDVAYQKTGNVNFRAQRRELLPAAPEVNKTAGTYSYALDLMLSSPDGMDVFYTFDEEAALPGDGKLYTEPIHADEGMWKLRAVAVNGELVSDELRGTYRIVMPSPGTPNCNLAPNTYKKRQSVRLRKSPDNANDDDIVIFYTIDGSLPDEDSPVYDGTPIAMPGGNVTLQAVAVNGYGKASNTFSRTFKFEEKPYPKSSYSVEDTANGVVLYTTTYEQFVGKFGEPGKTEEVDIAAYKDVGVRCQYGWGYAEFIREKGVQHLVRLYFTDDLKGPRGTGIGSLEKEVVGQFRDMGQVTSPSGNRGLYSITNSNGNVSGTGRIYANIDGDRVVRYICSTADSHQWQLDYIESSSGVVRAIDMIYFP